MKKTFLFILCSVFALVAIDAQKLKIQDGDFGSLNGQDKVKVIYTFEDLKVGKMTEADYIKKKRAEADEREAGTADKWEEKWIADRDNQYGPKFEELLNKNVGEKVAFGTAHDDAEYTLIVQTYFIEPGFNVGITRRPAYVSAYVYLVKTGDDGNKLATMEIINSPGADAMGFDYDAAFRIQEAYAKMGKEFGKFLAKKVLK